MKSFPVYKGLRVLLVDLGLRPNDILRRAGLPDDLFTRPGATLTTTEYFGLWRAIEEEANEPALPIRLGEALRVEVFDPAIFAAMCSPDLNTALRRISQYKRLIVPMALHVAEGPRATRLEIEWLDRTERPPPILVAVELVFFVQLARMATRARIQPERVTTPRPPTPADAYERYFGVEVRRGKAHAVTFSASAATRPFLTANEEMWEFFEPELRKRLSALDAAASIADRVRAVLLELLPTGATSVDAVARKLNVSRRTLQRRLSDEGSNFQAMLNQTRKELARHYLKNSSMSAAEISFLLGFEDPNSFFRAFHDWTGDTPERVRTMLVADS